MNIIFHIGYPKTASRWLQERLYPNISNYHLMPSQDIYRYFIGPNALEFDPSELLKVYGSTQNNLIISNHGFVGTTHNFGLNGYLSKEHARRISSFAPDARIILFIRNQVDIITSSYIQYIKDGGTYSINKYLFHPDYLGISGITNLSFKFFEYHELIDYYKKIFPLGSVHVFLFEDFISDSRSFTKTYCEIFNFKVDLDGIGFDIVNPGYRRCIISMARVSNHFTKLKMVNKHYFFHVPHWWKISKNVFTRLNRYTIFGNYLPAEQILGKKNIKYIREYYKNSNQQLLEKYGLINIKKFGYPL